MFINDLFNKNITESQTEKPSAFDTAKNAIGGAASKLGDVLPQAFKPFDEKTYTPQQTTKSTTKVARKGGIEEATADDPKFQQMMNKVSQQKTPQQHMEELENVLYELKSVERNIQEITREIKYDRTAQDIMVRVDKIINPFRPYIEDIDYREPFEQIQEAVNQLESAIYGLDELAKRAEYTISTQIQDIQDEIDYPDDDSQMRESRRRGGVIRSGSISEGLYPGEYYTFLVKFDDGTTETLNFSSDDIDWDRVGAKRNKKVVGVKMQGGIQGEPHDTPSKPHDFPDDRGLARAQRAYDRKIPEAANPAQQAAIAISMKKAGKKPKVTNEDIENYVESMQRHGYESVEEQKCPECGGVAYSDKMIAEEKDACYHKVKSRYKIWPSAYASGALVKCRKAGAKNWGNKSKK